MSGNKQEWQHSSRAMWGVWRNLLAIAWSLLLTGGLSDGLAASPDSLRRSPDSLFVQHYADRLVVKLDIDNDKDFFNVKQGNSWLDIRPNLGPAKIVSFSYRWFYLGIEYLPRFSDPLEGTTASKGKTTGFGIGTGINMRHWVMDLSYRTVKGFYLENTADYIPGFDPSTDDYIQFPNLETWMIRGAVQYKVNPRYSFLAIQTQTEAQRRSAVTIMPGVSYNFMTIDNQDPNVTNSQKSNTLFLIGQISVYGTLVLHRNWYLSGGSTVGLGGYYTWLTSRRPSGIEKSTLTDRVLRGKVHVGLGFNSERFFGGGEFFYQKSIAEEPGGHVSIEYGRFAYQLFLGYRFNAPGFLKKALDKLERAPHLKK